MDDEYKQNSMSVEKEIVEISKIGCIIQIVTTN